jgi:predicted metal-dependent hydrolase
MDVPLDVVVVRSRKRRKTVSAQMVDGRLRVSIPAWMSKAEEDRHVDDMVRRMTRRREAGSIDIVERTRTLARRDDLPEPATVRFVDNQLTRWGSCTPVDRSIRLSSRLAAFPSWVLDYVIVHELAHLVEFRHNARFHALVARYPKTERAIGFLIAKGLDPSDD